MAYVPPSRREDPNDNNFRAYDPQLHNASHHSNQQYYQQPAYRQHNTFHAAAPQNNYPRAQHGDRRAGPHPGGVPRYNTHHHQQQQQHPHHHHQQQQQQHTFNPAAAPYVAPYHREEKAEDDIFKEHTPGINFDQYESIQVSVVPNDIPPVETFSEMTMHGLLTENVSRCRYTKPTPVQKYGIPVVLGGRDLMACAQTGSGKTAAYLIPAVNFMLNNGVATGAMRTAVPTALIMAPTRELSIQIYEEGRKFTFRTGLRCVVVYGGADPRHQISELTRGCNLLVATPGRLWDMYQRAYCKFSGVQFLVLDEADRMLDMGFEPQIRQIVQGPESDMPRTGERQTLLYSATFPKDIQQLAREFLHQHSFLQVGRVGSTTENITQDVRWVEDTDKRDELLKILQQEDGKLVLVFVEKKRDADFLERFLRNCRVMCASIHGDRVQREREEALHYFKTGMCRVLVATDVASRGLDIPDVAVVVQYDLPSNIDDYVHRIGRTGRAGKTGTAISFFNAKNKNVVDDLVPLLRETKQNVLPFIANMVTRRPQPQQNQGRGRGAAPRGGFGAPRGGYQPAYQHNNNHNAYGGGGAPYSGGPNNYMQSRNLFQPRH